MKVPRLFILFTAGAVANPVARIRTRPARFMDGPGGIVTIVALCLVLPVSITWSLKPNHPQIPLQADKQEQVLQESGRTSVVKTLTIQKPDVGNTFTSVYSGKQIQLKFKLALGATSANVTFADGKTATVTEKKCSVSKVPADQNGEISGTVVYLNNSRQIGDEVHFKLRPATGGVDPTPDAR